MTDNDKAALIVKLYDLAKPEIIRNNRISIDWLEIINYIEKQNEKAFTDGVNVTHEYYGTPSLHPITYTKEQYEAYGDQRELVGLNKVLNDIEPEGIVMQGNMMMYKCNVELLLTQRIAELKEKEVKGESITKR